MKEFITFSALEIPIYGGKANHLALLFQSKFNVPNGFIVPAKILEEELGLLLGNQDGDFSETRQLVEDNITIFDPVIKKAWQFSETFFGENLSLAIRSSVNLEDGATTSFAGQFTTVLEVKDFKSFQKGFIACLLSKYDEAPLAYCESNAINPDKLQINIIIQEMVDADYSGVCFSVNPMTGNEKEMVIEAVNGLGENLVQGHVTPNTYTVNWYEGKIVSSNQENDLVLADKLIDLIVDESLKIQQYFGLAQDIEWAFKDGKLYILQARPLTAMHFDTKYDWTNADLKDGGISSEITTPFMYKLYEYAFETTMSPYLKSVKIHPPYQPDKWFTQFMLFSYWNLTATKDGVKKIPGFIEREFDEDLGVKPKYKGKGEVTGLSVKSVFQGVQILMAINKSIKKTIKNATNELAEIDRIIEKNKKIEWALLNDEGFIKQAQILIEKDYLKVEGSYFVVIYNNSNFTILFKDLLKKKNKKGRIHYLKLITGLQNLSHLQPSFSLWKISRLIRNDAAALTYYNQYSTQQISADYLDQKEIPLRAQLETFIDTYGFHSEKELNLLVPHWHENPEQAISTLLDLLEKKDSESIIEQNKRQEVVFLDEFQKIKSKKLRKEVLKHRHFLWLREAYRDRSTQLYDIIRKVYLIAGERLCSKEILNTPEDVFFAYPRDIKALFDKSTVHLNELKNNKIIFKSFRNFDRPNEIWNNQSNISNQIASDLDSLTGIACSYGVVEGEVYVAMSVKEATEMPKGKIMVTQFTDPAWTVYFSKIIGLITETGGMLSHGAIISREYGIPAVLGVNNITKTIKTGDVVRLDGNMGSVEIISSLD